MNELKPKVEKYFYLLENFSKIDVLFLKGNILIEGEINKLFFSLKLNGKKNYKLPYKVEYIKKNFPLYSESKYWKVLSKINLLRNEFAHESFSKNKNKYISDIFKVDLIDLKGTKNDDEFRYFQLVIVGCLGFLDGLSNLKKL